MESPHRNIVFYDGFCSLCNGFVDFCLRHDRRGLLEFAPIQGETFKRLLADHPEMADVQSMFLVREDQGSSRIYTHSNAALHTLGLLGMPWSFASVLLIIPRFVRDPVYRLVALLRYRLFGKKDSCQVARPEHQNRFLP
jgi:predicted DCC family thiol-disulfide oxidoreductase YuxK